MGGAKTEKKKNIVAKGGTLAAIFGAAPTCVAVVVAAVVVVLHIYENYVYTRHLDRIPDRGLAQTAAMQTENAFYYSYYAELVEADSFSGGLTQIIWDRRSEHPDVLNALERFNIYQEVFMAIVYRILRAVGFSFHPWDFFRYTVLALNGAGHGALALLASEISGNPLAGALSFAIALLNRFQISRLGNYSSSNLRELWGIPLLWLQILSLWRLVLAPATRRSRALWCTFGSLTFVFIVVWQFSPFLLLLQATALYFVYLVCGYHSLRPLVIRVIHVYFATMLLAMFVHFGSMYLLTSPFLFQIIALKVSTSLCFCERRARRGGGCGDWLFRRVSDVVEGLIAVGVFLAVRKVVAPFATADTHVYEILCTKAAAINNLLPESFRLSEHHLPDCAEPSFNARLYLVMGVFNLLERASLQTYVDTGAALAAGLTCFLVVARCVGGALRHPANGARPPSRSKGGNKSSSAESSAKVVTTAVPGADGVPRKRKGGGSAAAAQETSSAMPVGSDTARADEREDDLEAEADVREEAGMLFFVILFLLFFMLGCLLNRLRVAFGPPLMVLAACCCGPRLFPFRTLLRKRPWAVQSALFVAFCCQTLWTMRKFPCINEKEGICQHFADKSSNDGDLADLCDWINRALDPPESFPVLSSMNVAGSLRLFTGLPLVVHPQFESENLRKRVQMGYELYHCGSEESFAKTMRKLQAEIVIFEYARCFFTPYILDDKRKNCDSKKHKPEDQLCFKLHAKPQHFKLIFTNGGYAVFRLRETPLTERPPSSPSAIAKLAAKPEAWQEYLTDCVEAQGSLCGARILETAGTMEHGMKRKQIAATLRKLSDKLFPKDGYVAYYLARYFDYDAEDLQRAAPYYEKAVRLFPNNAKILHEYLMFLDMGIKDPKKVAKLLRDRQQNNNKGFVPMLEMEGSGVGEFLCEAAVSAKSTPGLESFGDQLWARARSLTPLASCLKTNWQLVHGEEDTYEAHYKDWDKVRMVMTGGVQHKVASHHQPPIRFEEDSFLLSPAAARRARAV